MIGRLILFLLINFAALAIGGFFTGDGVSSDWYEHLNKAPWTPPGWVFGAAWTSIMILFSIYMAYQWEMAENRTNLLVLYSIQWILNVTWNPIFFYFQMPLLGLVTIVLLTILIAVLMFKFHQSKDFKILLLLPYFVWLLIATSLNAYVVFENPM